VEAHVVAELTVGTIPVAVPGLALRRPIVVTGVVEVTGSPPVDAPAIGVAVAAGGVAGTAGVVAGAVVVGSVLVGSVAVGSVDVTEVIVGSVAVVVPVVVVGSVATGVVAVVLVVAAGTPVLDASAVTPDALGLALRVAGVLVDFAGSVVVAVTCGTDVRDALAAPATVVALVDTGSGVCAVAFAGALEAPMAPAAALLGTAASAAA
jgi:hypothetical protein